jgi:Ser/Thr protein kinase RdoA (MazF antagonist)
VSQDEVNGTEEVNGNIVIATTESPDHPSDAEHPFSRLNQTAVMNAVETQGFQCDGCTYPLNSYENRVYQVGIEGQAPMIAKIYRPDRWSAAQIREEHEFCFELIEQELPAIAPWRNNEGESLFEYDGFLFAIFERRGGHAPEFAEPAHLEMLGRLLGRIHAVGGVKPFEHRPSISLSRLGTQSIALISTSFIPVELKPAYDSITRDIMAHIEQQMGSLHPDTFIRVHGDCHAGNILWRDDALYFVDFDDTCMAPAVQDIWMLLSGDRQEQTLQLEPIFRGYRSFCHFNFGELRLIESLRTLRIIHYAAWLARRWQDPAFPMHFPWFNTMKYWSDHILTLREQLAALQEPPLEAPLL